jgi:hypothetical protein
VSSKLQQVNTAEGSTQPGTTEKTDVIDPDMGRKLNKFEALQKIVELNP